MPRRRRLAACAVPAEAWLAQRPPGSRRPSVELAAGTTMAGSGGSSLGQIAGILTSLATDPESEGLLLRLQENKAQDNSLSTPTGSLYWVRLAGSWVSHIEADLRLALRIKIYLDSYGASWDPVLWRYELRSGIKADLTMPDGCDRLSLKKIDLAPLPATDSALAALAGTGTPLRRSPTPLLGPSCSLPWTAPKNSPSSPLVSGLETLPGPTVQESGRSKRPRLLSGPPNEHSFQRSQSPSPSPSGARAGSEAERPTAHRAQSSLDEDDSKPGPDGLAQASQSRPVESRQAVSSPPHVQLPPETLVTPPNQRLLTLAPPGNELRVDSPAACGQEPFGTTTLASPHPKSKVLARWKTLKEIENLPGGPNQCFNVMGIITQTKTELCEKAGSGTCDFKMTLYITDNSRPATSRDVTCNLFWKAESNCPPWLKASWKVILLWSVYKRRSQQFNTQLVGPSGSFKWALWSPAYLGSDEQIELDPSFDHQRYSQAADHLEQFTKGAQDLYEIHQAGDLLQDGNDPPAISPQRPASVVSRICDLKSRPYETVDLAVKVVDLWQGAPDNDRLTVTDFTCNPKPITNQHHWSNMASISHFHTANGGRPDNFSLTSDRLFSIYVPQPILKSTYHQLTSGDPNSIEFPSAHHLRSAFENEVFKIHQVGLRCRNDGTLYGVLELNNTHNSNVFCLVDQHCDGADTVSCSQRAQDSRIVALNHSDPIVKQISQSFQEYQNKLAEPF